MSATGSGVRLHSVTKQFRNGAIGIEDVSVSVEDGEFVTFLGPSGSGKTTTLNTIAGFLQPTAGSVEIGGRDVTALPTRKRNLGMVFQNYALFPHMSVRDNVAFGLHGRGLSKQQVAQRIDESLAMVRLQGLSDRTPKQISGGQQQRVALARALVYRPPVLLMDEPLGALDKALRTQMQVEITRIHREVGTTFLFVTHDQDEALGMSDRIVLFNDGRVIQEGTPAELYEKPHSLFAAQFLGDSNVFRGPVSERGKVRIADATVSADTSAAAIADRVAVIVRPERMRINCATDGDRDGNSVSATITDVAYQGAFRRIAVQYMDGSAGLLHESIDVPASFVPGDTVTVSWDPAHSVVVKDPSEAA
jgi:putative spermidine/putrescine transport system ATP-binding protein